jgi:hypothetical protein
MQFLLFSKLPFEVIDSVGLIECYCFQTNFYANYDSIPKRKIEDVNNIGARIPTVLLPECKKITEATNDLPIFRFTIDTFLGQPDEYIDGHIRMLNDEVLQRLTQIKGISLSTATKILHTLYPDIIPIIDNTLKEKYKNEVNYRWMGNDYFQIISDYFKNLKIETNWVNICQLHDVVTKSGLILSKIRIFDIIWWSYLKSKNRIQGKVINWSSIK